MLIAILVLAALLLLAAAAFLLNRAMFRPEQPPEPPELSGRAVTIPGSRGPLAARQWNPEGTRGLVLLAHGMGTSIGWHLPEAEHFAARGYQVLALEYTGYRGSAGHFGGFARAVLDLRDALACADSGELPVILTGHSMGAYAVCAVQQLHPTAAVIAYAPFSCPGAAIRHLTGSMPAGKLLAAAILAVQRLLFGKYADLSAVRGLQSGVPALILQGSEDREVPCGGCSLYARRTELPGADFRLITDPASNQHMTVIRQAGQSGVNRDTMALADEFLDRLF